MIIEKGRPHDPSGRLQKEIRVYDLLDRLKIEYDRADHAVVDTMEDCQKVSSEPPCRYLQKLISLQPPAYAVLSAADAGREKISHQRACPDRSAPHAFLLPGRNIWNACWISLPVRSASWG